MRLVLILFAFSPHVFAQEVVITKNGSKVILNSNGTWSYVVDMRDSIFVQKDTLSLVKGVEARNYLKSESGKYAVWYQNGKWRASTQKSSESADLSLHRLKGDAYAMTIAEGIPIAFDYLKEIAIENARNADPNARIVSEEYRFVNERLILHLKIEATVKGVPLTFLGYYYSGDSLTLQFLTYTATNLLKFYEQDCFELLNGLEIYE